MTDEPILPTPDPLQVLRSAGLQVDHLSPDQQQALAGLDDDELALLLSIRAKLDDLEPEVQAHSTVAGGGLF